MEKQPLELPETISKPRLHKVTSYPQTGFHHRSQPSVFSPPEPLSDTWKV